MLLPEVVSRPAKQPAKKLLLPVMLVAVLIQLTKLVLLHNRNTGTEDVNCVPLINRPVELTQSLLVPPGAMTTVLVSVVVPRKLPRMMLSPPVVTQQPALQPRNMLLQAVVLQTPAWRPMNTLSVPVVLSRPAQRPAKKLSLPVVLQAPANRPAMKLSVPVVLRKPAYRPRKVL